MGFKDFVTSVQQPLYRKVREGCHHDIPIILSDVIYEQALTLSRSSILRHALRIAMPFRSDVTLAAEADVLGT